MGLEVDASNACVPPGHPLVSSAPPLPRIVRGEPAVFDGRCGRINDGRSVLLYGSGRLVVVRELDGDLADGAGGDGTTAAAAATEKWMGGIDRPAGVKAFVYRGHTATVSRALISLSRLPPKLCGISLSSVVSEGGPRRRPIFPRLVASGKGKRNGRAPTQSLRYRSVAPMKERERGGRREKCIAKNFAFVDYLLPLRPSGVVVGSLPAINRMGV